MAQIIVPPSYRYLSVQGEPIIFLAGPIQGARDWQSDAAGIIRAVRPDVWIANPRRPGSACGEFSREQYEEQVEWEHHHCAFARSHGVMLFWCENESVHACERAYAQTTRFELGESMGHLLRSPRSKLVVGLDTAFSGSRYIRLTFARKAMHVPILGTLEDTCRAALALLPPRK